MRLDEITPGIRKCKRSHLVPNMAKSVSGNPLECRGPPQWLVPGKEEDIAGRTFKGRAGRLLKALQNASSLRKEDFRITGALKCSLPGAGIH
jgi:uracil-DNA glycosylase family 4